MKIEENKQYDFNSKFTLPGDVEVNLECSLFKFKENVVIVSFLDNQKFTKHVFDHNLSLINFENYYQKIITCSTKTINELIEIYNNHIKLGLFKIKKELNEKLIKQFNIEVDSFTIIRSSLRYSFWDHEVRNKNENNDFLYKNVEFFSVYAKEFSEFENKNYLNLDLFKNKNTYWYCISNSSGDAICKFVFSYNKEEILFTLIQRENYIENSELIDFNIIKDHFKNLTNTSEQMHLDVADDIIQYYVSVSYGYLFKVFEKEKSLPLLI